MPLGYPAITETKPVLAYIGLGANLGDPAAQLRRALAELAALDEVEVLQVSSFYLNPPLGPPDQPWYINAVIQARTRLAPAPRQSATSVATTTGLVVAAYSAV